MKNYRGTIKYDISQKWLVQKANNWRYNAYITLFYFTISPFLSSLKDPRLVNLNKLNDLILKLSENLMEKKLLPDYYLLTKK